MAPNRDYSRLTNYHEFVRRHRASHNPKSLSQGAQFRSECELVGMRHHDSGELVQLNRLNHSVTNPNASDIDTASNTSGKHAFSISTYGRRRRRPWFRQRRFFEGARSE